MITQRVVPLGPFQRWTLYAASALVWSSGAAWLYFHSFAQGKGEFGPQTSAFEPLCLKLHGAAAMLFMVVFGALLPAHVSLGWEQKRQRSSGAGLVLICVFLFVTGWMLYYVGDERIRLVVSAGHSYVGLGLAALLGVHARAVWTRRLGRRETSRPFSASVRESDSSTAS